MQSEYLSDASLTVLPLTIIPRVVIFCRRRVACSRVFVEVERMYLWNTNKNCSTISTPTRESGAPRHRPGPSITTGSLARGQPGTSLFVAICIKRPSNNNEFPPPTKIKVSLSATSTFSLSSSSTLKNSSTLSPSRCTASHEVIRRRFPPRHRCTRTKCMFPLATLQFLASLTCSKSPLSRVALAPRARHS